MIQQSKSQQLAMTLMREINDGNHGLPGTPFITIRELCSEFNVSLQTAQNAIDCLKGNGMLLRRGRRLFLQKREIKQMKTRVAILVPHMDNPYYSELINALELRGRQLNLEVIAVSAESNKLQVSQMEMLKSCGAEGLIVAAVQDSNALSILEASGLPFVLTGMSLDQIIKNGVAVDDWMAGQIAALHLIECGCQNFLYFSIVSQTFDRRLAGYQATLESYNFLVTPEYILQYDASRENVDSDVLAHWLLNKKGKSGRTGIFCFHDLLAMRIIRAAKVARFRIPQDLCVIGMDNLPASSEIVPSLTSISYPLSRMADSALRLLLQKFPGMPLDPGIERIIQPSLIHRESTSVTLKNGE